MTLNYPLLWNPNDEEKLSEELEALQAHLLMSGLLPDPNQVDPEEYPATWELIVEHTNDWRQESV